LSFDNLGSLLLVCHSPWQNCSFYPFGKTMYCFDLVSQISMC